MKARALADKIWDGHVVADLGDDWALLHIDRHLVNDLTGEAGFAQLDARSLDVSTPELNFATPDHAISSAPGRTAASYPIGERAYANMVAGVRKAGIRMFDFDEVGQGILHVIGPELGLVLPGTTVICGDSHTCTNGGLGALAFGAGTSQYVHALATQTLRLRRPKPMRIIIDGALGRGVTAKDLALHLLGAIGASGAVGHIVEYAGGTIRAMGVEGRLTLCNLAVEMGARSGIVAPDEIVFDYLRGRPFAPAGDMLDRAMVQWRNLATDDDAEFARERSFAAKDVQPTISWGTSPDQVVAVNDDIPDPADSGDINVRQSMRDALAYMGLEAGRPLVGTPVDWVFIGSCTNSRISDLREAAAVVKGRMKAGNIRAWVVPGSVEVKRVAEAEGLDQVFKAAGFEWREPGCSMCVAANGEQVPSGARSISTTNRNFIGRQGPGARTHLTSPAMAAAAAIAGAIVDVRIL